MNITKKIPLTKGLSGDRKFYIEADDGQRLLMRVSGADEYNRKKAEFENMKCIAAMDVPMSQPIDFGICDDGSVYTLLSWIDGDEVETILPTMTEDEQYALGLEAGRILRTIHNVPAPEGEGWYERYFAVMDERIKTFRTGGVGFEGSEYIIEYLEENRHLLRGRPQCRHHGDYHAGNLILSGDGRLYVIDWHTVDFENYGDPWYEFNRIGCDHPAFAAGQINGYFSKNVPDAFWKLFAYYLSAGAITSVLWAKYCAPEHFDYIMKLNKDILFWFDNMKNPIPIWYRKKEY